MSEDKGKMGESFVDHKKFLFATMNLAHQSQKLDDLSEKSTVSEKGIFLYKECSQRFKLMSPFLPKEHALVLNKFSKVYADRAKYLSDRFKNEEKQRKYKTVLPKALNFRKETFDPKDMELDEEKPKRTYAVMMRLKKSILKDKGYFILPNFFVPKAVWYQENFSLEDMAPRLQFFKKLSSNLHTLSGASNKLSALNTFTKKFHKELSNFKSKCVGGETKKKKKKKKKNLNEDYVGSLIKFFDSSQFLSMWIDNCPSGKKKSLYSKLEEVSHLLYFSVLTVIVFKDLFALIENYFRKCRQKFSKLVD